MKEPMILNSLQAAIDRFIELQKTKIKDWVEDFVDEDTGDVVQIERKEIVTEEHTPEEEQLLELINQNLATIDTNSLLKIKEKTTWFGLDPSPLLRELYSRGAIDFIPEILIVKGEAIIPDDMEVIPDEFFCGCRLKKVVIPKTVKRIGNSAFASCDYLVDVQIENGVVTIGEDAFGWCKSLTAIHIPDSVTEIGCHAFLDCWELKTAYVGKGLKELKCQTFGRCIQLESLTLSEGTEQIDSYALDWCWRLRSLEIPSTVKTIMDNAFEGCYFLTEKFVNKSNITGTFGEKVADIIQEDGLMIKDNEVIYSIDLYESITFPKCITRIQKDAFDQNEHVKHFYYAGTKKEWKKIKCEIHWIDVIHCCDGDYLLNK